MAMDKDEENEKINYFPGHMARALREIGETVRKVDAAVLVLDARAPLSSFPEGLEELVKDKAKAIVLTKIDLADPKETDSFMGYFRDRGYLVFPVDLKKDNSGKALKKSLESIRTNKDKKFEKLGFALPPIKCLILGIPNVGKSTLINVLGGKKRAQTENVPGKTKRTSLFRATDRLWLFDTPGILQPRVHDQKAMTNLALVGSVKDTVLPHAQLAIYLLGFLKDRYPNAFKARYGIEEDEEPTKAMEDIAKAKGYLLSQGKPDIEKAIVSLLMDFKSGQLGRMTVDERPD